MKLIEAQQRVEEIRNVGLPPADVERVHELEDKFREDVLRAIAKGTPMPHAMKLAKLALSTRDVAGGERWCA